MGFFTNNKEVKESLFQNSQESLSTEEIQILEALIVDDDTVAKLSEKQTRPITNEQRQVFIIEEEHKSPQKLERIKKILLGDSQKSDIEKILTDNKNEIQSLQEKIKRLKKVISNKANKITRIGIETSENELKYIQKNIKDELSEIETNLKNNDVKNFSKQAEDFLLLLNGPIELLLATNDPILKGVELIALESEEDRRKAFSLISESHKSQTKLRELVEANQISVESSIEFKQFINQILKNKRIPDANEISQKTRNFENTAAKLVVDKILENVIGFIQSAADRDQTMVRKNFILLRQYDHYAW